jgi:hypothetical protein
MVVHTGTTININYSVELEAITKSTRSTEYSVTSIVYLFLKLESSDRLSIGPKRIVKSSHH